MIGCDGTEENKHMLLASPDLPEVLHSSPTSSPDQVAACHNIIFVYDHRMTTNGFTSFCPVHTPHHPSSASHSCLGGGLEYFAHLITP